MNNSNEMRQTLLAATQASPAKVVWRRVGYGQESGQPGGFASRECWDASVKATKAGNFVWVVMTDKGFRSFRDESLLSVK